jgi:5'-methylthioadenosine phosphorylase
MAEARLAVIGGSGLYAMQGLQVREQRQVDTPFGPPSAPILLGELQGQSIAFLARHGPGHSLSPSEVNYRANFFALKTLGVERIIAVSACGSLRKDYAPGSVVIPDQLFDFTRDRPRSFFGRGLVAHVGVADPFCPELSKSLADGLTQAGGTVHTGGTFITIEGPRFSTRAESNAYRAWGMSIIGMTTCPEAFLAREAEICYAVMAHVTDYDVWHLSEEPVTVEMVVRTLHGNTQLAQAGIVKALTLLPETRSCTCKDALRDAVITDRASIPAEALAQLSPLVQRYLT